MIAHGAVIYVPLVRRRRLKRLRILGKFSLASQKRRDGWGFSLFVDIALPHLSHMNSF
jgi:hypothetical protein